MNNSQFQKAMNTIKNWVLNTVALKNHNHDESYANIMSEHVHSNKSVLDNITQQKIDTWDASAGAEVDLSDYVTNEQLETSLGGKANATHSHATADITGIETYVTSVISGSVNNTTTEGAIGKAIADGIAGLVDSAPGALDTLNELANALGDNPNFATTIASQISAKADATHTHQLTDITGMITDAEVTSTLTSVFGSENLPQ